MIIESNEVQDEVNLKPSKFKSVAIFIVVVGVIVLGVCFNQMKLSTDDFSAYSKLSLPDKAFLIDRMQLVKEMEDNFQNQAPGIQVITLTGMQGSGKTTMAKIYANKRNFALAWEINAERKESLINSFNDLAFALAVTAKQREKWLAIQKNPDPVMRGIEIMDFIKPLLKRISNWLLIYDNVEDFSEIQDYFLQGAMIWGNGKIIVTTCDPKNANVSHEGDKNIFVLAELSSKEVFDLYCNIVYGADLLMLTPEQKENIAKFLKHIPPFPLDVSGAAYYIKHNRLNHDQYLKKISEFDGHFENSQQELLRERSGYEKTRNGITLSVFEKIIETNEDFKDLLLLMCLVDSQSIPKKLLESCKSTAVVESFVSELKKYSLITGESGASSQENYNFSVHRSTQVIGIGYFTKVKKLEKDNDSMQSVVLAAVKYIDNVIEHGVVLEQGELSKMQPILNHGRKLLGHVNLLTAEMRENVGARLGLLLFSLSRYEEAQVLLEKTLESSGGACFENSSRLAKILAHLGLTYKELGSYEKAQDCLERGLAMHKEYSPSDYMATARFLTYLGTVYRERGNYTKAEEVFKQSLEIYGKHLPEYNGRYSWVLGLIGITYIDMGRYQEAKDALEKSVVIYKDLPMENIRYFRYLGALGIAHERLGDCEKARELLTQSVEGYRNRELGEENYVVLYLVHLGHVYSQLGNNDKAKAALDEGIIVCKKSLPKKQNLRAHAYAYLGALYGSIGKHEEAIELIGKSLSIYEKHYGKDHIETAGILKMLGRVYLFSKNLADAESTLNKAFEIASKDNHPSCYSYLEVLAELHFEKYAQNHGLGDGQKQAMRCLEQALELVQKHFPENSPHITRINAKIRQS